MAFVTLQYERSISVECAACRKSKSQNTGFPFYQLSSVQSEGKSKSQNTGFSFYQLSNVQSGGKSKSQNTGFPFYQFIKHLHDKLHHILHRCRDVVSIYQQRNQC